MSDEDADIVERLRDLRAATSEGTIPALCDEAADEIELLRSQLGGQHLHVASLEAQLRRARA